MENRSIKVKTLSVPEEDIRSLIFTIRGVQVMIDSDLASIYGVDPKRLNEQVKRNGVRFPETFRFQLTQTELDELITIAHQSNLRSHIATSRGHGGRRYLPYVFTEQGWFAFSRFDSEALEMFKRLGGNKQ